MKIPHTLRSFAESRANLVAQVNPFGRVSDEPEISIDERKPSLLDRLESVNRTLCDTDELFSATRLQCWGDGGTPVVTLGDVDGQLLQLLDVVEQRVDALRNHARAFAAELGR